MSIICWNVFPGKSFQPSLPGPYSEVPVWCYMWMGWKGLAGKNTLAYYKHS